MAGRVASAGGAGSASRGGSGLASVVRRPAQRRHNSIAHLRLECGGCVLLALQPAGRAAPAQLAQSALGRRAHAFAEQPAPSESKPTSAGRELLVDARWLRISRIRFDSGELANWPSGEPAH